MSDPTDEVPDDDTDTEVVTVEVPEDLATKLIDAKQALDEVKEYYADLRDQMVTLMKEHHTDGRVHGVAFGATFCTYSRVRSRRFSSTKLRREFPDLYAQFLTTSYSDRLAFPKAVTGA